MLSEIDGITCADLVSDSEGQCIEHRLPTAHQLRDTSHTRLRARDQYTSSTLIGGKDGAGPSSLHNMLEGPTEYVCECKMDVKFTWIPTWHRMDRVSWSLGPFSKITSWR